MTDVTIVATTWLPPGKEASRSIVFNRCIGSWEKYLKHDDKIHLHIADDGSDEAVLQESIIQEVCWTHGEVTTSSQKRHGVGASLNTGLKIAFNRSPLAMYTVDDWELIAPLDLTPWVGFLEYGAYDVGMVRFFGHPDLTGTVKHIPPYGWAVDLDRHHYVFATRPCLWHQRMFEGHLRGYGWFMENVSAIKAERDFNERVCEPRPNGKYGPGIWLALPEIWRHTDEEESLSDMAPA